MTETDIGMNKNNLGVGLNVADAERQELAPPTLLEAPLMYIGAKTEVVSLDEGTATLVLPGNLSKDSCVDLHYWMAGILRKARRRSGVTENDVGVVTT